MDAHARVSVYMCVFGALHKMRLGFVSVSIHVDDVGGEISLHELAGGGGRGEGGGRGGGGAGGRWEVWKTYLMLLKRLQHLLKR